jgi:hypothetical protein
LELFLLYIWLKLNAMIALFTLIAVAAGFTILINWIATGRWLSLSTKAAIVLTISGIFAFMIPTSKDTAILVGAHYALQIGKSETGQKVMSVLQKRVNEYLDKELSK